MGKQNLTLTVDADLLKRARKLALDHDTSVNQLVRDYLTDLVGESDQAAEAVDALRKIWKKSRYSIGNRSWTREDLYADAVDIPNDAW